MKKRTVLPLTGMIGFACWNMAYAETAELDEVKVVAKEESKSTGEIKKSRRIIQDELIMTTRDLVRYTTDVGISDNGRHNKGFAMRGVEGNRVGISIDGVALPDFEENSLYARYGNFNSSRIQIDPELVTGIDIMRGSDSFNQGSGSLGGGVSYRTVIADDIIPEGDKFGVLLRSGYTSKNREWTYTAGTAYKDEKWEIVGMYSQRRGHELSSLGNGEDTYGSSRGIPDPSHHKNHNYLAKLAYFFNDHHRLSVSYSGQNHENNTEEKSYTFTANAWRNTKDITERDNLNVAYEYFPTESRLAYVKVDYDWQKTTTGAINFKGSQPGDLDDVYDRNMKNDFHRLSFRADGVPIETAFGTHTLSLKSAYSEKMFKNINRDIVGFGENYQAVYSYMIQKPIKTRQAYLALQDKVIWNDKWSSEVGVRYDLTKITPKSSDVYCQFCGQVSSNSTTFQSLSGNAGIAYQFNPTWKGSYYLSSGYRVPSASEMYFTFLNASGNWLANPNLKPEQSLNHTLALQADSSAGNFAIQLYRTQYRDFLYERETLGWQLNPNCDFRCSSPYYSTLFQQAVNIDKAKIEGVEISGKANLEQWISSIPVGWNVMGAIGYSKGKLYNTDESLLSIQPVKVILGAGYDDPQDRWSIQARWSYLGAKKAKDAQILTYYYDRNGGTETYPFLNGSATLFDIFGFVKVGKNVILRAGAYNIFNRKYHTWDALRGINLQSTTNTVDREGKGLERFYSPGRNFALMMEVKF